MPQNKPGVNKMVIAVFIVLIVILALVAVVPMIASMVMGLGVRTEGLSAEDAEPATTDLNGEWQVARIRDENTTSVGFTFFEILPGERKHTSGSTQNVEGFAEIEGGSLTAGEVVVDMASVSTDNERRDINVRNKILSTDEYPTATFTITEPADVSAVPDDGTVGTVTLTGDLEVRGVSKPVTHEFDVLRDGEHVIVAGDIPINRHEYGVESPDFVAASIDDEGELNIRLSLEKTE